MKQNHSRFLIPGILLLGVVLRAPFTTLSTVLSDIAASFGVEVSSLGLLTSLPLLTFAIFSPFATSWARRFGIERLFSRSFDPDDDWICSTHHQSPSPLCGNSFDWCCYCLYQCPSTKLDPS